jgi:hypothetical protein
MRAKPRSCFLAAKLTLMIWPSREKSFVDYQGLRQVLKNFFPLRRATRHRWGTDGSQAAQGGAAQATRSNPSMILVEPDSCWRNRLARESNCAFPAWPRHTRGQGADGGQSSCAVEIPGSPDFFASLEPLRSQAPLALALIAGEIIRAVDGCRLTVSVPENLLACPDMRRWRFLSQCRVPSSRERS